MSAAQQEPYTEDDGADLDAEWYCTYCGGDGWMDNDDQLWYGHDNDVPCSACAGTGHRKHQTIF
jgi:DnaJ-class molecular chaperone